VVKIEISKAARQTLFRSNKRLLIAQKIEELAENPASLAANVLKLRGRPEYRLRVQDWRILFRIEDETLYIDEIEPRGSVYEDRT
jgi:mRNA interferase RelE/StbE